MLTVSQVTCGQERPTDDSSKKRGLMQAVKCSKCGHLDRYLASQLHFIINSAHSNVVDGRSVYNVHAGEHVDGSVQPMVLCKKRGIDAHGGGRLTVSPAELPVP